MTNKKILTLISFLLLFSFLMVGCIPKLNQPPEITSAPVITATVGVAYTYKVVATDPNAGDVLTYSLTTEPPGMLINGTSGVITWTPDTAGDFPVTVEASDGKLSDTQSFTITVSEPVAEPEIELTGIVVAPKSMTLFVGESEAIESVTATYEIRGYEVPIALEKCTYTSSATTVATVSDTGLVTGVAEGTATITVSYGGETDTLEVTVNPVLLTSIVVLPEAMTLSVRGSGTITSVTANYNDGSTADVLGNCTYESDDEAVATVLAGEISALTPGIATITVSYEGKTDTIEVTVNSILLTSIVVLPEEMTLIGVEDTEDIISVTAHYSDGSTKIVTSDCSYLSNDKTVADIDIFGGEVTAVAYGEATITVTYMEEEITKTVHIEETDTVAVTVIDRVHNVDADKYYETITEALDDEVLLAGDTILVAKGTYAEDLNLDVEDLTLKSNVGATIQGGLITITGEGTVLDGFKMRGYTVAGWTGSALPIIDIAATDVTVQNMDLYQETKIDEPWEITIQSGSDSAKVLNCVVDRGFTGGNPSIFLVGDSDDVLIEGNEIAEHGTSAIGGSVGAGCTVTVRNNIVYWGYDEGIWFCSHKDGQIVVEGNTVEKYDYSNAGCKALKIVDKPASVNGKSTTEEMLAVILADNPGIDSVDLDW